MLKVACALIIEERKILLTQNGRHSDHPFQWEFPGGKIMLNESPADCVKREILEELELEIEPVEIIFPVKYDYGFKKIELIPIICMLISGNIRLNDHHDFRWIELKHLDEFDLSGADRKLIQNLKNLKILKKYIGEQMH